MRRWFERLRAPKSRPAQDWRAVTSYGTLERMIADAGRLPVELFFSGPFERFIELSTDPANSRGEQARTMQFAHARSTKFRDLLAAEGSPGEVDRFDHLLADQLHRIAQSEADHWLIDVWEGRLGHHGV